jgi:hypothetical protein
MFFKDFNEYSAEEIGLLIIAEGLGEHPIKLLAEGRRSGRRTYPNFI